MLANLGRLGARAKPDEGRSSGRGDRIMTPMTLSVTNVEVHP